jgi:peptide/nickel transport system permease protein
MVTLAAGVPAVVTRRRRRRPPVSLMAGVAILGALIVVGLGISWITPYSPTQGSSTIFGGMSGSHWLGTDNLGRDLFTRVFVGARFSLRVDVLATLLAAVIGVPLGLASGYFSGRVDSVIMRVTDTMMALPPILVALALIVILGHSNTPLIIGIGVVFIPYFARVVRAHALTVRERDFVAAARVACVNHLVIMWRHILPNVIPTVLVQFANTASIIVIIEASLSYLGLGVEPPAPSWGQMIFDAQQSMEFAPMTLVAPALLVSITTVGWNLLADGLQLVLSPKS